MKERQDAFGRALLDTHLGKGCVAVIERDDGLVECDTLEQYFTGYGKWSPLARRVVRCATGHVLDIGAGAGRHSLYLQNKGLRRFASGSGIGSAPPHGSITCLCQKRN
jgi:hypothetical protein